jgi:hypothetical protein
MWVFDRSVLPHLGLSMGDWNLSPQIKLNAFCHPQVRAGEVHITQRPRKGRSHQQYFSTGFSHAWWVFANRFTRRPQSRALAPQASDAASLL